MPNAEKVERVAALKERIQGANALLLAEYRGLSVHDATELRRSLSEQARFAIVKNTLFQRAAADAGVAELETLLDGPTAVAFVDGDIVATAKKVVDAAKKFPALVLKGGYLDGKILSAAEAQALATLESREVLLSKVAGMMKAEMQRAASMFQAIQGRFLGVLEAYKDTFPGEPEAAEPAAEAEAAPATEPEPAEAAAEPAAEAEPAEAAAKPAVETEEEPAAEAAETAEPADEDQGEAPAAEAGAAEASDDEPENQPETADEAQGEE
jgi:large subunit ribosomal protein L10